MPIVGGLDIHRKQITFDYLDTVALRVSSGPTCGSALAPPVVRVVQVW